MFRFVFHSDAFSLLLAPVLRFGSPARRQSFFRSANNIHHMTDQVGVGWGNGYHFPDHLKCTKKIEERRKKAGLEMSE